MGDGLRVLSDGLNLDNDFVHHQAKDHNAETKDSKCANGKDFIQPQAMIYCFKL
jgi:hypothetical protein